MSTPLVGALRPALGSAGALGLLGASLHQLGLSNDTRAVLLVLGFSFLTAAVSLPPRRLAAPAVIGAAFVVLGGLSALYAATEARPGESPRAFAYAALVTSVAALAATGTALLAGQLLGIGPRRTDEPSLGRVERAGKILVAIGFAGLILALVRFAVVELPTDDPWESVKSFWRGSSYLLLLANAAIPGFALWSSAALRRHDRRSLLVLAGVAALYVAGYVPTGQRGILVQLALVGIAVLVAAGLIRPMRLAALLVVGVVLAGLTQAVRNEIRETRAFEPERVVERLSPERWGVLYGSQIASFDWTWDVAARRDELDIPNTFLHAALKPVPRQLLPGKVQGFAEEFTATLYPKAYAQQVSFATPLTAEADYNVGLLGVLVIFVLLGGAAAVAEIHLVRRAPSVLAPAWAVGILWTGMVFIRGDFANALVFSSGFVVPLAVASIALGFRPESRRHRFVIDGLQVPAAFSGVGRQVLDAGEALGETPLDSRLEVRCAEETLPLLRDSFPRATRFRVPIRRSRPRGVRILYQQLAAPLLDAQSSVLLCFGDQAPFWGRSRVVLVVNDVRRLRQAGSTPALERLFYRLIVPRGIRRASRVLTISEFSASEIRRSFGDDLPLTVVHYHALSPEDSGTRGRMTFFLSVGALRPYKGADTIVDALAELAETRRPEVVFAGAGGDFAERVRARADRAGVADSVRLVGWVDSHALEDLYRTCAATIHASVYEGYGLPLAESLSRGTPAIVSDIPAHREVAGDAAVYFTASDPMSLSRAIERVLSSETVREELAIRARARSEHLATLGPTWRDVIVESAAMTRDR